MYEQNGLLDPFFLMLYGGAMMLALTSCCYMLVYHREDYDTGLQHFMLL